MFLKWLKKLLVIDEVTGRTTVIENLGEQGRIISVRKDGVVQRFVVFRRNSAVPAEVANDPTLEFYKRQKVKQREIVLAFGVDDSDNLKQIEDASALGSVSSFLPLVEERSGAKFLIQSDFLVQPGREAIQYELSWNRWLISEAAETAKEAINEFKKHPKWKTDYLAVFNFTEYWGQAAFDKLFRPHLQEPLTSYLQSSEIYPTISGDHVKPERVVQVDEQLKGLLTDQDLPLLFKGRTDLRLADPSLDVKAVPPSIQNMVNTVSLALVARNKSLLEEKVKQKDHEQWFVKLYSAMADTDQYFKDETWRNHSGRYQSRESPIYVITDRNAVVSAKEVYLGPVPAKVLQLRRQFPEVDNLLASYQLIHPKLHSPELEKFFKERTHVQPIDYDKICRQVFLPQISINSAPPQKDDLVAYTRLIQKGPAISDPIWVSTKSGNTKPSNQVFLGTDYFPSEDWEKHAKYCPQIEFLSTAYLSGVPQGDVPSWKDFFKRVGVKDQADNPYV
ncbi:MAG: hypothetical protein Q8O16_03190, partial [Dehalococcoidia bacterium]|nr:hypothetical protein [Dehalococcoidia bacterium]